MRGDIVAIPNNTRVRGALFESIRSSIPVDKLLLPGKLVRGSEEKHLEKMEES